MNSLFGKTNTRSQHKSATFRPVYFGYQKTNNHRVVAEFEKVKPPTAQKLQRSPDSLRIQMEKD